MYNKRYKQCNKRRISKVCISLFNNCHQTELCDGKCQECKDRCENCISSKVFLRFFCRAVHTALHCIYTAGHNTGDYIYCCGDSSKDDQQRNDRCQDTGTYTVLDQPQHRYRCRCQLEEEIKDFCCKLLFQ